MKIVLVVSFLVLAVVGIWYYVDYNSASKSAARDLEGLQRTGEALQDALDAMEER
jgi:hypothetical protein